MKKAEKILIYRWGSLNEPAWIRVAEKNKTECVEFSMKLSDYHADAVFAQAFIEKLHEVKPDAVFSYDYFPVLSMLCDINGIPYFSWIYDCPQYTLLSGTVQNTVNHIFCFDAVYAQRIRSYGAQNVCYFPLGADVEGFEKALEEIGGNERDRGKNGGTGTDENEMDSPSVNNRRGEGKRQDAIKVWESDLQRIVFVGDLYNGEKNRLRRAVLSDYSAGYVEGLIRAQLLVYGYNLLFDSMPEHVAQEIVKKCSLTLGEAYRTEPVRMAADAVGMEVSAREREQTLIRLSECFPVTLYTGADLPETLEERRKEGRLLTCRPYADYEREVPFIFHNSRINLNITSRTIESGIPQRVFDILACGGFCLTGYQPEIAEYFTDGEDLVMYGGMEELMEKAAYYLAHEEERAKIAKKGYERVKGEFALESKVKEMLSVIAGDRK